MSLIFICNPCKTFSVVVNFRPTLSLTHMTQRCERSPYVKGEKIVADVAKGKSVPAKLDQALRPSSGPAPAKPAPAVEVVKFQKPAAAKPAAAPGRQNQPPLNRQRQRTAQSSGNKQQLQDRRVEEVVRVTPIAGFVFGLVFPAVAEANCRQTRFPITTGVVQAGAEWVESVGPKNALAAAGAVASYAKVYGAATVAYASARVNSRICRALPRRYPQRLIAGAIGVALGLSRRPGLQVMQ